MPCVKEVVLLREKWSGSTAFLGMLKENCWLSLLLIVALGGLTCQGCKSDLSWHWPLPNFTRYVIKHNDINWYIHPLWFQVTVNIHAPTLSTWSICIQSLLNKFYLGQKVLLVKFLFIFEFVLFWNRLTLPPHKTRQNCDISKTSFA